MMTNVDLENMADKLGLPIVGVFSKDELIGDDKAPRQIGSYYINMQDSTEGNGTHWIFAKIFESGHGLYFDSFGFSSSNINYISPVSFNILYPAWS